MLPSSLATMKNTNTTTAASEKSSPLVTSGRRVVFASDPTGAHPVPLTMPHATTIKASTLIGGLPTATMMSASTAGAPHLRLSTTPAPLTLRASSAAPTTTAMSQATGLSAGPLTLKTLSDARPSMGPPLSLPLPPRPSMVPTHRRGVTHGGGAFNRPRPRTLPKALVSASALALSPSLSTVSSLLARGNKYMSLALSLHAETRRLGHAPF